MVVKSKVVADIVRAIQVPENTPNRGNIKIEADLLEWIRDEQYRIRKAIGSEPTQSDVIRMLIAERERHDLVPPPHPDLPPIPKSLIPVIDWLIKFFAIKGPPEAETLKDSIRMMSAIRASDLKRRNASKTPPSGNIDENSS